VLLTLTDKDAIGSFMRIAETGVSLTKIGRLVNNGEALFWLIQIGDALTVNDCTQTVQSISSHDRKNYRIRSGRKLAILVGDRLGWARNARPYRSGLWVVAILTAVPVSESYNLRQICIFNPRPIVD
jgi:hypothetical protein